MNWVSYTNHFTNIWLDLDLDLDQIFLEKGKLIMLLIRTQYCAAATGQTWKIACEINWRNSEIRAFFNKWYLKPFKFVFFEDFLRIFWAWIQFLLQKIIFFYLGYYRSFSCENDFVESNTRKATNVCSKSSVSSHIFIIYNLNIWSFFTIFFSDCRRQRRRT